MASFTPFVLQQLHTSSRAQLIWEIQLWSVLHQAKLEPPIFSNDGVVHPQDWLQSVVTYRSSLDLTDA